MGIVCDRCHNKPGKTMFVMKNFQQGTIDLCNDCWKAFNVWLKDGA